MPPRTLVLALLTSGGAGDGTGDYGINFGTSLEPQLMRGEEGDTARFVYSEGTCVQHSTVSATTESWVCCAWLGMMGGVY